MQFGKDKSLPNCQKDEEQEVNLTRVETDVSGTLVMHGREAKTSAVPTIQEVNLFRSQRREQSG